MATATTNVLRAAREHLGTYYLATNPAYKSVDFQQKQIIPTLEALERGDFDRLMIFMPSGHAKSDIVTKAFSCWYMARNPGKNVILFSHTEPLAADFGGKIRDQMRESQQHAQIFPEVTVRPTYKAKNFFRTTKGNDFYAFGMDGGAIGRRADLIIIDDPIRDLQDALSDTVQSALHNTYKAVVSTRLRPKGKLVMCMTRWAVRDLPARILEEEGNLWHVLALPAQKHVDGCTGGECDCPYLWESYYGRLKYDTAKLDSYLWDAQWQQVPRPALNQGFQEEWLRFYLPMGAQPQYREGDGASLPTLVAAPVDYQKLFKFNTYMLVDPAMGKEAAHDRTCILVMAAGPEGRLFLVDAVLDRLDPGERIDHLLRLARLWKPKQIVYEEYALTADSYFLNIALKEQGITDLVVTSVGRKASSFSGGRLKKHDRIMQLVPDFRDGRIWLPKKMVRELLDGTKFDIINYFINREYLPYAGEGSIAHDDMLDCMSRIRDPEVFFEHRERQDDDYLSDEHWDGDSGSWESRW